MDGEPFINFTSAAVDVTLKGYRIKVEKLFPDKKLSKFNFFFSFELSKFHLFTMMSAEQKRHWLQVFAKKKKENKFLKMIATLTFGQVPILRCRKKLALCAVFKNFHRFFP